MAEKQDEVMGRVELLDVARGIAILGILFMNMPTMADYSTLSVRDPRLLGWSVADQWAYIANFMVDGTFRGLLQMLFGAGMMIALRHTLQPSGPIGPLRSYNRRNLWLIVFGLVHALVLLWPGDILFIYGLAALLLPAFRHRSGARQFRLGIIVTVVAVLVVAGKDYSQQWARGQAVMSATMQGRTGSSLSESDRATAESAQERQKARSGILTTARMAEMRHEQDAHRTSLMNFARFNIERWYKYLFVDGWLIYGMAEAFGGMMIGAALYQWGVITGSRSMGLYVRLGFICYVVGFGVRALAVRDHLAFDPAPPDLWRLVLSTADTLVRLLIATGHIAILALVMKSGRTEFVRPFAANGRMPLTTYFAASLIINDLLMPGYAGDQWARHGFAAQMAIAIAFMAAQCLFANMWFRSGFATGPLEWVWKSLAYKQFQPWRRVA